MSRRTVLAFAVVASVTAVVADSATDVVTLTGETTISSSKTYNARITGSGSFRITNGAQLLLNHGTTCRDGAWACASAMLSLLTGF